MGNILWETDYIKADLKTIETVENNNNIKLPIDYRQFVISNHGGRPTPNNVDIPNYKKVQFNYLLVFIAFDELDILDKYNSIRKIGFDRLFPFAIDLLGNIFCFDYSVDNNDPQIIYFDTKLGELNLEKGIFYICNNFTDFIRMLH